MYECYIYRARDGIFGLSCGIAIFQFSLHGMDNFTCSLATAKVKPKLYYENVDAV